MFRNNFVNLFFQIVSKKFLYTELNDETVLWFFKVNNLTDLFENVKIDDILSFLRETELYQKNMTT